jgi:hypothetical protein
VPATTVASDGTEQAAVAQPKAGFSGESQQSNQQSVLLVGLLSGLAVAAFFGVVMAARRVIRRN